MGRPPAIYAEAFGRDPQFAHFYRSLEAYRATLNKRSDVLVVSPDGSEFFRAFGGNTGAGQAASRK